jgi:hypothetical protein
MLRTATCFGRNRPPSGYQYNVVEEGKSVISMEFAVYNFYCVVSNKFTIYGHPVAYSYRTFP